jgi:hypothetical protein
MMQDITFEPPSVEGLGLDGATEAAFGSFGVAVRRAFEELNTRAQDPASIRVETSDGPQTLRDLGSAVLCRGMIVPIHCSWASALMRRGFVICDGSNGTPKIHPRPNDSVQVQRFIRATLWGTSSGATGGTSLHTHSDHDAADIAAAIKDHDGHTHSYNGTTNASCCATVYAGDGYEQAASTGHTHFYTGKTNTNTAGRAHEAAEDADLAHNVVDHTPPYCDVIFLMKE